MGSVRVARMEITGLSKEAKSRWRKHSEQVQQVTNTIWQQWLVWHIQNGSADKIRSHLNALAAWREADKQTRGEKPKLDLKPVPPEVSKLIYDRLSRDFPDLHSRPWGLVQNATCSEIRTRKAAKGVLSGWMAILLCNESIPSTTRPNPIPFDKANCKILPPEEGGKNYRLEIRLTRLPREGKAATSVSETVEMYCKGRKAAGQAAIVRKALHGEYTFKGSSILVQDGKFFAMICYERPRQEMTELDAGKAAYLYPGLNRPWKLRLKRNRRPGGWGNAIGAVRRKITQIRRARSNNQRFAGSSTKGHGRDRAWGHNWKLQKRWNQFVKSFNHGVTKDVVRQCVEGGYGTLVYYQPCGELRHGRFLFKTGKTDGLQESSGWDWFQVKSQLEYKCQEAGIRLIVRKFGEKKSTQRGGVKLVA